MYKEVPDTAASAGHQKLRKSHYLVCELPVKVSQQKVPLDKPNVRLGVGKPQQLVTLHTTACNLKVCVLSLLWCLHVGAITLVRVLQVNSHGVSMGHF